MELLESDHCNFIVRRGLHMFNPKPKPFGRQDRRNALIARARVLANHVFFLVDRRLRARRF